MSDPIPRPYHYSLPREIWDIVFSDLKHPELATCTLLSRRWLDLARPCLFRSVFIDVREDQRPSRHVHTTLPDFISFLDAQTANGSALPSYIRKLVILGTDSSCKVNVEDVSAIISRVPNLHTLHIRCVFLSCATNHCRPLLPNPMSLRELRLYRAVSEMTLPPSSSQPESEQRLVDATSGCGFLDLITLFSSIDTLALDRIHIWDLSGTIPKQISEGKYEAARPTHPRVQIREFSMRHTTEFHVMPAFIACLGLAVTVQKLHMDFEFSHISKGLLEHLGDEVTSLHLECLISPDPEVSTFVFFCPSRQIHLPTCYALAVSPSRIGSIYLASNTSRPSTWPPRCTRRGSLETLQPHVSSLAARRRSSMWSLNGTAMLPILSSRPHSISSSRRQTGLPSTHTWTGARSLRRLS